MHRFISELTVNFKTLSIKGSLNNSTNFTIFFNKCRRLNHVNIIICISLKINHLILNRFIRNIDRLLGLLKIVYTLKNPLYITQEIV